ncbi:MAG: hypothetical protein LBE21_06990 [Pseudomonadales bacterium]|jgi:hypothetical protein|nr:hypothetical protein [Pseudomonadales bacterium]
MKCQDCGQTLRKAEGDYLAETKELGSVRVPKIRWLQCPLCKGRYLPAGEITKVNNYIKVTVAQYLAACPISQFVSATKAGEILGVTKQAFSKNQRIKHGFIYAYPMDGKQYYLKESVQKFKETGDGRVPLSLAVHEPVASMKRSMKISRLALNPAEPSVHALAAGRAG